MNNHVNFSPDRPEPQSTEVEVFGDQDVSAVEVRVESSESMQDSALDAALDRVEASGKEEQKQKDATEKLQEDIDKLVASIKGLDNEKQGQRVREFNQNVLHPLGKHLAITAGQPRMSNYTAPDERLVAHRIKINALKEEIHNLKKMILGLGIATLGGEYQKHTKSMRNRRNRAPEIARAMRESIQPAAKVSMAERTRLHTLLTQKTIELNTLMHTPWQNTPLPSAQNVASTPTTADAEVPHEESAPRFQRRVPMDRLTLEDKMSRLDPATADAIRSLAPELRNHILGCIDQLNPEEKETLKHLCNKFQVLGSILILIPFFDHNHKLRTPEDMRNEALKNPTQANEIEKCAKFLESISPAERALFEKIVGFVHTRKEERVSGSADDPNRIARHIEYWKKAKESNDEAGIEIAEGMLLMNGVDIDKSDLEKGKIVPLEDGFGGKGMGFFLGLIKVVDGFLKKFGEKMEEKRTGKKPEKNEKPIAEMNPEEKQKEIDASEKRLVEGKKEKGEIEKQIQSGEKELEKETDEEVKPHLKRELEDLRSKLRKVGEEIAKEEKRMKELKEPVQKPTPEKAVDKNDVVLEKINKENKEFLQALKDGVEKIKNGIPNDKNKVTKVEMCDFMYGFLEKMTNATSIEKNEQGQFRQKFDVKVFGESSEEKLQKLQKEMNEKVHKEKGTTISRDGDYLVTEWCDAQKIERVAERMTKEDAEQHLKTIQDFVEKLPGMEASLETMFKELKKMEEDRNKQGRGVEGKEVDGKTLPSIHTLPWIMGTPVAPAQTLPWTVGTPVAPAETLVAPLAPTQPVTPPLQTTLSTPAQASDLSLNSDNALAIKALSHNSVMKEYINTKISNYAGKTIDTSRSEDSIKDALKISEETRFITTFLHSDTIIVTILSKDQKRTLAIVDWNKRSNDVESVSLRPKFTDLSHNSLAILMGNLLYEPNATYPSSKTTLKTSNDMVGGEVKSYTVELEITLDGTRRNLGKVQFAPDGRVLKVTRKEDRSSTSGNREGSNQGFYNPDTGGRTMKKVAGKIDEYNRVPTMIVGYKEGQKSAVLKVCRDVGLTLDRESDLPPPSMYFHRNRPMTSDVLSALENCDDIESVSPNIPFPNKKN